MWKMFEGMFDHFCFTKPPLHCVKKVINNQRRRPCYLVCCMHGIDVCYMVPWRFTDHVWDVWGMGASWWKLWHYHWSSWDGSEPLSSPKNLTWHRTTSNMTLLIPWCRMIVPWVTVPTPILKEMEISMHLQLTLLVGESWTCSHIFSELMLLDQDSDPVGWFHLR